MSKKRAIMGSMILVLITGLVTFTLTNVFALSVGDKVLVSKQNYEYTKKMNETYSKMNNLKSVIKENYYQAVDENKFEDGIIKGLFEALDDPYSVYMNKQEFTSFMEHTHGSYGGIGVVMSPGKDGFITVVAPFEDTPGDKAGMQSGDKIIKVNDKDVTADHLDEAVAMIKGKPGTKVTLTIMRLGKKEPFSVELTREEIRIKTVKSRMLEDGLAYLRITMFDEKTSEDFMAHLKKLEKQNIKGLVIDLRDNPGGLLSECVRIADRLLGKQTIVYTQNRAGKRQYEKSDKNKVNYPLVLLVNGGSASASEILSGAVKDTKSGTLIGTTTFGKGLVQQVIDLKDGTGFKLTTSQYFTPNGIYIHGKGIEPNIVIEMPEALKEKINITDEEDVQLQKGIEVLKEKISKE
ncbi:S41 family peptidase [Marinisporobacter balticus]|uniref:Carboxyl-terminal processing protease n=1 Tax=Marinisporobacter balticus TaxID=2018667 RepID=A0A4R2KJG8_9FIRM|nr:S41 family peptidase [Marinisporobacter balticus]TCO70749.1 carboxyl-terminal processing protease [Marinisporobacter balticus]